MVPLNYKNVHVCFHIYKLKKIVLKEYKKYYRVQNLIKKNSILFLSLTIRLWIDSNVLERINLFSSIKEQRWIDPNFKIQNDTDHFCWYSETDNIARDAHQKAGSAALQGNFDWFKWTVQIFLKQNRDELERTTARNGACN